MFLPIKHGLISTNPNGFSLRTIQMPELGLNKNSGNADFSALLVSKGQEQLKEQFVPLLEHQALDLPLPNPAKGFQELIPPIIPGLPAEQQPFGTTSKQNDPAVPIATTNIKPQFIEATVIATGSSDSNDIQGLARVSSTPKKSLSAPVPVEAKFITPHKPETIAVSVQSLMPRSEVQESINRVTDISLGSLPTDKPVISHEPPIATTKQTLNMGKVDNFLEQLGRLKISGLMNSVSPVYEKAQQLSFIPNVAVSEIAGKIVVALREAQTDVTASRQTNDTTTGIMRQHSIQLQLVPKTLGVVDIKITNIGGKISIQATIETKEAANAIKSEIEAIRVALRSAGVSLENVLLVQNQTAESPMNQNRQQTGQDYLQSQSDFRESANEEHNGRNATPNTFLYHQELQGILVDMNSSAFVEKGVGLYF